MPNKTPLFSIVLPTRDRPAMLLRAVSSVLRQSLPDFEVIIIDDGSEVPSHVASQDPRIRIIHNPVSVGVAQARNIGIGAAKGAFVSFLDDDDEYLPAFLSSTYARLRDSPADVGLSWCGVKFVDDSTNRDGETREFRTYQTRQALFEALITIGTSFGLTVKATCLRDLGPFNTKLKVASDTDFFFRFLSRGFVPVLAPGIHVLRHDHDETRLTGTVWQTERIRTWDKWLFVQYADFLKKYPSWRNDLKAYVDTLRQEARPRTPEDTQEDVAHVTPASNNGLFSLFPLMRSWFARSS
jgi:glycosyltransferase involved in cell wall biosynthesis